jgi:RimJ/RimL family protein N-acetyltransferase
MGRLLRIFWSQLRDLSLADLLVVLRRSFFKNDLILVYAMELSEFSTNDLETKMNSIRKGEFADLENAKRSVQIPPWEFRCNEYDGVTDFFIATKDDSVQHISWIYYGKDPNRILQLQESDAEVKYCLTLPEFRGQGLYPRTLRKIAGYLHQKMLKRVFICVNAENVSSVKGIEKAGFKRLCKVRLRKVAGIQYSKKLIVPKVNHDRDF